jgi:hypothetical protein
LNAGAPSGGSSQGGAPSTEPVACGAATCEPVTLLNGYSPVPACCAGGDKCGLDSDYLADYGVSFPTACQALHQPGELTTDCPDSASFAVPNSSITITLKGCCRAETGTCGYDLTKILGVIEVGLGCVDSTPFQDGAEPKSCDRGAGGAGGAASNGGAGGGAD